MPTWWGRKSCKNKDDNHRGIISTDRDIKSSVVVVDPPLTPTRVGTPRCSVSSSGSADDQSQLVASRGHGDVKFNVAAAPRSPERASPKAATATIRPTSPLHQRLSGVVSLESSTGRNDDGRSSSECHPLPRPPTSPTSPSAVHGSWIGGGYETTSPKWKKGKFLGSGTFGQVYLGFNSEIGKMCAIKEVKVISDDQTSKECLKQLNQEINLLNQLCHPNIVQYYGSELSEETLSVYLEYVSGGSIHKLLKEYGSFTEPVIQNYTRQILAGLAYLHGRNTVHRDIKGANILVDPNGEIKLAAFGMVRHVTTMLSFKGSPYWMAPEVVMSQNGYTSAVDIWSLGCTILEMATSKPPWSQFEGVAAIFKIGNSEDTPEIPDHLSNDAKNFIRLCLQRNPTVRPTASQLLEHPFLRNTTRVASTSMPKDTCPPRSHDGSFSLPTRESYPGRLSHDNYPRQPLSRTIKSPSRENVRAITSLPVSPCSSPLRQLGPAYKSCFLSPPHPSYAFPGQDSGYNLAEFAASPFRMKKDTMMEPASFRGQTPNSPLRSRLV
ncbi:unnamed protein product [Arabidopsis arenosa]|uniref:mitogen-activated protein kinase kinase kinase n=1 Tax=Arabidopsis arenosa TaxID=38785 RepID=A0A8S1ZP43_ARAAE|nr:unnamed protein product [Arabidopsis arenosa]